MVASWRTLVRFFREIWRRRVLQVAVPYGVVGWLIVEVSEVILDAFESPAWVMQAILTLLVLGFPVAVVLAWIFDLTPRGSVVRTGPLPEEPAEEPEPLPALPLEMGDSERRRLTLLNCQYELTADGGANADPEALQAVHDALRSSARSIADRHGAYLLPGGAQSLAMAFGFPVAREGDARRAVAAGLSLFEEARNLAESRVASGEPSFSLRAGVATGLVVVDESPSPEGNVSLIGQVPQMAAWLAAQAPEGSVVVEQQTYRLIRNRYQTDRVDSEAEAPGGADTEIHRVIGASSPGESVLTEELLVGREDEMRHLAERWEDTLDGAGQFVVMRGDMGIGKSSLISAFVNRVADTPGVITIPCQCSPYESHNPLAPVIQLLQGPVLRFGEQDSSSLRLQKLKRFAEQQSLDLDVAVPLLARLLALDPGDEFRPPSASAQALRQQTLQLLQDLISQAAAQRPVLMVLEDLHWADPTTLEMIRMMIDRGPQPGLFLLFSARPEFTADWTERSSVLVCDLSPLSHKQTLQLIGQVETSDALPPSIVQRIVSETDGNPLYALELTRAVLDSDAWRSSVKRGTPEALDWLEIPATLQDSLAARVDRLGSARSLLQLCSVLGREFSYELLRVVSGTENEPALKKELSQLVQEELLYQKGIFRNQTFTFRHILIQETAYDSLLRSKRRELHGKTAEVLETDFPDLASRQPSLMARHFSEAGIVDKAIAYWTLAGRQALERFANQEAIAQAHRGLEVARALEESPQRAGLEIPLQSVLGTALLSTYGYAHPEVQEAFSRALLLCEQIGDAPQLFQVAVGLWMYYCIASHLDEALNLGQRLLRIAESTQDPVQKLQARYCLAFVSYYRADFIAARLHLEAALRDEVPGCNYASESPSGDDTRIHLRVILAHVYWHFGRLREGERLLEEGVSIAKSARHPWGQVFAQFQGAWYYQMRAEPENVLKYAGQATGTATEKGFGFWLPLLHLVSGWAATRQAGSRMQPADRSGIEQMEAALKQYRAIGSGAGVSCCLFMLAEDYIWLEEYDHAAEALENAQAFMRQTGEHFFEPEYHRLHGRIHLERYQKSGDRHELEEAAVHLKQGLAQARHVESKALELRVAPYRAQALASLGQAEQGARILTSVIQRTEEFRGGCDWEFANGMLTDISQRSH